MRSYPNVFFAPQQILLHIIERRLTFEVRRLFCFILLYYDYVHRAGGGADAAAGTFIRYHFGEAVDILALLANMSQAEAGYGAGLNTDAAVYAVIIVEFRSFFIHSGSTSSRLYMPSFSRVSCFGIPVFSSQPKAFQ